MCLTTVNKRYEKPLEEERIGYKIFVRTPLAKNLITPYEEELVSETKWNKVTKFKDLGGYQAGYHIYPEDEIEKVNIIKNDLRRNLPNRELVVFKVKYNKIVAEGFEYDFLYGKVKVDVALEMKVI